MLSSKRTATPRTAPRKKAIDRDDESNASRSQRVAVGDSLVNSSARLTVVEGSSVMPNASCPRAVILAGATAPVWATLATTLPGASG